MGEKWKNIFFVDNFIHFKLKYGEIKHKMINMKKYQKDEKIVQKYPKFKIIHVKYIKTSFLDIFSLTSYAEAVILT